MSQTCADLGIPKMSHVIGRLVLLLTFSWPRPAILHYLKSENRVLTTIRHGSAKEPRAHLDDVLFRISRFGVETFVAGGHQEHPAGKAANSSGNGKRGSIVTDLSF